MSKIEHRTYKGVDYRVTQYKSDCYDCEEWIAACDGCDWYATANVYDVAIKLLEDIIDGMEALGRLEKVPTLPQDGQTSTG